NRKLLGRLAPRSSTFDLRNHSLPHLPRIGLRHRPASQKRINADRLSHPRPHENPPDSIGAEHALGAPILSQGTNQCPAKPRASWTITRCPMPRSWSAIPITKGSISNVQFTFIYRLVP